MHEKKISIIDVAKKAGVSTATVSRVVNQLGGYSKETELKVKNTIDELGFRPNANAIGLRTRRSNAVGVIVPDITNEFFAKIVRALDVFFVKNNYSLFICDSNEDVKLESRHIQDMLDKNVDGIIYISGLEHIPTSLIEKSVPLVFIDRTPDNAQIVVESDNYQGGYLAGEELVRAGCRKPVLLRDYRQTSTIRSRTAGFCDALKKQGCIICDETTEIKISPDYKSAYKAVLEYLEKNQPFDGIFATNDMMALGAMHALIQKELYVPEKIKLVGFDNISLSEFCSPPITTIAQDTTAIAETAAQLLLKQIKSEAVKKQSYVIPVNLIRRSST